MLKWWGAAGRAPAETSPSTAAVAPVAMPAVNPLEAYFDAHAEGPGIWKWRHYFDIYHRHFAKFVGREVHVLEIGIYSGGSLGMWQQYFGPKCKIYGVDIVDACKSNESDSVKVYIGDQADRDFLAHLKKEIPVVDIVIDDGGHQPRQQIISFEELFPHLSPGGVYLCEDTYKIAAHDYFGGLARQISELGNPRPGLADPHDGLMTNAFQRQVKSLHLYPFVAVLEKQDKPVDEFTAPRRGSQWL